jgi:hypothetical protein
MADESVTHQEQQDWLDAMTEVDRQAYEWLVPAQRHHFWISWWIMATGSRLCDGIQSVSLP